MLEKFKRKLEVLMQGHFEISGSISYIVTDTPKFPDDSMTVKKNLI